MTNLEKKRLCELENVVRNCYFLLEKGYVDAVKEILKAEEEETNNRYKLLDKEEDK